MNIKVTYFQYNELKVITVTNTDWFNIVNRLSGYCEPDQVIKMELEPTDIGVV